MCDSYGYGLLALNTLGDTTIIDSKFYHNGGRLKAIKGVYRNGVGGNALFIFSNMLPMYHVHIHIKISNSEFAYGTEFYDDEPCVIWQPDVVVRGAGGLGIVVAMSERDNNISILLAQ